jgi:hypothetical protein
MSDPIVQPEKDAMSAERTSDALEKDGGRRGTLTSINLNKNFDAK